MELCDTEIDNINQIQKKNLEPRAHINSNRISIQLNNPYKLM